MVDLLIYKEAVEVLTLKELIVIVDYKTILPFFSVHVKFLYRPVYTNNVFSYISAICMSCLSCYPQFCYVIHQVIHSLYKQVYTNLVFLNKK